MTDDSTAATNAALAEETPPRIDCSTVEDDLARFAKSVEALDYLLKKPRLANALGANLIAEFKHPMVAFRTRFRAYVPEAQQDLFSAAAPADTPHG
ncbi:hypothetical protein RMR16_026690 (plasmid) [Agrobacterium sp. rho-13.3]|uniref:hypothetical protein n=1 Tax=Agrobacterium sp. rho-13.3 TaxID=3072980 RepID=UPI002A137744|nr:hypothetical protein [Agrobacterium sp. rho-13.3]MDX8311540.1 hypothetical protein [Agrobacterium sp. rho-13.3]